MSVLSSNFIYSTVISAWLEFPFEKTQSARCANYIQILSRQILKNRIFVFKYSETCLNVKGTTKKTTTNEMLTQI